ncbi:hypothetical protein F4825DRAFT_457357 [Nemania diffusa]|nr:hypothetical protein F4825DRAFT_457357 [Nemania diffusa]
MSTPTSASPKTGHMVTRSATRATAGANGKDNGNAKDDGKDDVKGNGNGNGTATAIGNANTNGNGNTTSGFTPINAARASSSVMLACGFGACTFETKTAKGIHEHHKNKHLGTICYWKFPDGSFCAHETETHEQLYAHFSKDHLKRSTDRLGTDSYRCPWPGNPDIPIPNGRPILADERCKQTFQSASGAERHAREHQYKIWRAIEDVDLEERN